MQLRHFFFFVNFATFFCVAVKSATCRDGSQITLDTLSLNVLVVEPAEIVYNNFRQYLNDKRKDRLDHFLDTLLPEFKNVKIEVVAVRQNSTSCVIPHKDLNEYGAGSEGDNAYTLLGATAAAAQKFPLLPQGSTSVNTDIPVVVIFADSFLDKKTPDEGTENTLSCSAPPPTTAEAAKVFSERGITVFFISPNSYHVANWDASFRPAGSSTLQYFPPALHTPGYETLKEHKNARYFRTYDRVPRYVRKSLIHGACDRFPDLTAKKTEPPCLTNYDDYALELVWLFNTQSQFDTYFEFVNKMLDSMALRLFASLEQRFSQIKTGVASYDQTFGPTFYFNQVQKLTTDLYETALHLKNVTNLQSGAAAEASLLGVSLAVSTPEMGWTANTPGDVATAAGEKKILKVVLLTTDDFPGLAIPNGNPRALGNPTDSASRNNIPLPYELGQTLKKADVTLAVVVSDNWGSNINALWVPHVEDMREAGGRVIQQHLDLSESTEDKLLLTLLRPVDSLFCSPQRTLAPQPVLSSPKPMSSSPKPMPSSPKPTSMALVTTTSSTEAPTQSATPRPTNSTTAAASGATTLALQPWLLFLVATSILCVATV